MLRKRVIPVILLRNGIIVQSRMFKRYQALGSPTAAVERLSNWASDELIYLDISTKPFYELRRDDLNHESFDDIQDIITLVSKRSFMPLTFGGGICSLDDISCRLKLGADKVTLNSLAVEKPEFIAECAREFGSQCIVVSMDVFQNHEGEYRVFKRGKEPTLFNPVDFAVCMQEMGAGELLLNSVNRDGTGSGFDIKLIQSVSGSVNIPVVAMGGCGKWEDFEDVLIRTEASAVAAANIFHHSENSVYDAKQFLFNRGLPVRKPLELSDLNKNL